MVCAELLIETSFSSESEVSDGVQYYTIEMFCILDGTLAFNIVSDTYPQDALTPDLTLDSSLLLAGYRAVIERRVLHRVPLPELT